ncbi:MAG: hypothetical protein ACKODX_14170, partial [Gemmata sp.]
MNRSEHHRSPDAPAAPGPARDEFPGFANVFEARGEAEFRDEDPAAAALDRRMFLALSAAVSAATLAGCRRPEIPILPFGSVPDEQVGHGAPGKPTFYATSLPRAAGALPVLVESHDGRPTKIEGNPQHPCGRGGTDAHAQAAVLDLYSPDRVMSDKCPGVMQGTAARRWDDFDRYARESAEAVLTAKGKGLYVLTDQAPCPSLRALREAVKGKLPHVSWHSYEACDTGEALTGTEIPFGARLVARYRFDRAERVLALDSDFLGGEGDSVYYSRAFADKRRDAARMSRLYVVEPAYTVTGTMADHRLRLPASQAGAYLLALAKELKTAHRERLKSRDAVPELPDET